MDSGKQKRALLEGSSFFKGFSAPLIEAIVPALKECSFDSESAIVYKGDVSDSLYLIREGEVEISVSSKDGKIIVLGTLGKGDVFGEIGLLDHGSRTANVSARTDVTLYRLNTQDFNEIAKQFGLKEWAAITAYICKLFRSVTNNLEETSFLDTGIRVSKKILELYEKAPAQERQGAGFNMNISQEVLGRMVGLSREATNKTLARLEDEGLIEKKYKNILVPDVSLLRRLVEKADT